MYHSLRIQFYFIFLVIMIICGAADLYANSFGKSYKYDGIGFSADYINDKNGDPANDGGLNLAYRYGFISIVSAFITADAGYQFDEKSWNGKAGFQGLFLFFGLEAGLCGKYFNTDKEYLQGGYTGLIFSFPATDDNLVSLSTGGNFYGKGQSEFYLKFTMITNFPK